MIHLLNENDWTAILSAVLAIINLITFGMYGWDKHKAIMHMRRIRNRTLLGLAVCGGSFGALLGMIVFRHKTKTWYYLMTVPAAMLVHIYLITLVVS